MKALLVADSALLYKQMRHALEPRGFGCIQYRSALKALFNLDEIEPDVLFIATADFPRHWKILSWMLQSTEESARPVLFLINNPRFGTDDAGKAASIGANAIVDEDIFTGEKVHVLYALLERYRLSPGNGFCVPPSAKDSLSFFFIHPVRQSIVTGLVESYMGDTLVFRPDAYSLTISLKEGTVLADCTLVAEGKKQSVQTAVIKNSGLLTLRLIAE